MDQFSGGRSAELQRERRVAEALYHPLHRKGKPGAPHEARARKGAAPNKHPVPLHPSAEERPGHPRR